RFVAACANGGPVGAVQRRGGRAQLMNDTLVRTADGVLRGTEEGGSTAFHGVPFAHADRWRPAGPPPAWPGVRDATRPGCGAPQPPKVPPTRILGAHATELLGEDCL